MNARAVTLAEGSGPDVEDAFGNSRLLGGLAAANSARKTPVTTTNTPAKIGNLETVDRTVDFFFIGQICELLPIYYRKTLISLARRHGARRGGRPPTRCWNRTDSWRWPGARCGSRRSCWASCRCRCSGGGWCR